MNNSTIIKEYAKNNYTKMFREPSGILKYKFIVPGSVYSDCLWDWDSWLTDIALFQFSDKDIYEYQKGCILNYLCNQDESGRLPIEINRFNKRPSVENSNENGHKPCLAQHAAFIIKNHNNDASWLKADFDKVIKYIDWYIENCRHKCGLYYWKDDCSIGVDNDPCTFYRPDNSSASILLNCFMYKELLAVSYICDLLGYSSIKYKNEAESLKNTIQKECYDEKDGFYYSVDLNLREIDTTQFLHSGAPRNWDCLIQRIGCWSGFLAMWAGIATAEQAERMVKENLLDSNAFWSKGGVRTLSKYEKMYQVVATGNPSCWLGPIWGVSNYLVFRGLVNYGYNDIAKELAQKTIDMFANDIKECGEMHEYYDPESAKPVINPGFQNWNLLSINMAAWLDGGKVITEF